MQSIISKFVFFPPTSDSKDGVSKRESNSYNWTKEASKESLELKYFYFKIKESDSDKINNSEPIKENLLSSALQDAEICEPSSDDKCEGTLAVPNTPSSVWDGENGQTENSEIIKSPDQVSMVEEEKQEKPLNVESNIEVVTSDSQEVAKSKHPTILFCHGAGENITELYERIKILSSKLHCHILLFEYPGFNFEKKPIWDLFPSEPSEKGSIDATFAAYDLLTKEAKVDPNEIYVWGQGIGSGPAIHLASSEKHPIKGLILQSAILSAAYMHSPELSWTLPFTGDFNIFENQKNISKVNSKILLIHGKSEKNIPSLNSRILQKKAKKGSCHLYEVENADYNDILTKNVNIVSSLFHQWLEVINQ